MNDAPEAAESAMQHPKKRLYSREWYNLRLQDSIIDVRRDLSRLAGLGRPGHWILHGAAIYFRALDTRPYSRNDDEETPVPGHKFPEKGLVWAKKGPAPNFRDITFWEAIHKDLAAKIEQVKAGLVQPRFTPEELQTLESLEQQEGHFLHVELDRKRRRMVGNKHSVFNILLSIAKLGRPGQWVLHNEELYHPVLDTRPQTRSSEKSVVIRDSTYKGDTRVLGDGLLGDYELTWAGSGPQPDFSDFFYWENKAEALREKRDLIKQGLVQPRFTPDELRILEAMDADKDNAFAVFARELRESNPVDKTPGTQAASAEVAMTKERIAVVLNDLWDGGLPGKWVLHGEDLYIPAYDTSLRELDEDEDQPGHIVIDSFHDLRLDTRFKQPPDLDSLAYWKAKLAELEKKSDDVEAGRLVTHDFSAGDLLRIKLLERAILEKEERVRDGLAPADADTNAAAII